MKKLIFLLAFYAGTALLLAFAASEAIALTDGTDQFCDCVSNTDGADNDVGSYANASCQTQGIPKQSGVLMCEDFEISTLSDARGTGAQGQTGGSCSRSNPSSNCYGSDAPTYGPWYDNTGGAGRGRWSYWSQTYGAVGGSCAWQDGAPASPTLGVSCPGGSTCWAAEWRSDNAWQGNSEACIDIITNSAGEWDDEDAQDLAPLKPDGSRGGYGNQTFAHRISTTSGKLTDISGAKDFSPDPSEIGITYLVALSTNAMSSEVFGDAWKWDEWGGGSGGALLGFYQNAGNCGSGTLFPFCQFAFSTGGESACNTAKAAATITKGAIDCTSGASVRWQPTLGTGAGQWKRDVKWADPNKWLCMKAHYTGVGTSSMTMEVWADTGSGEDKLVDISGFDGRIMSAGTSLAGLFQFNGYANYKQTHAISHPLRRYEDNIVVTNGSPVSCTDVGFYESSGGGGGGGSGPSSPVLRGVNLRGSSF